MKYKIGDRVRIRKDLEDMNIYNGFFYSSENMGKYLGKNAIITYIDENTYRDEYYKLDIDNGEWGWPDEMLEKAPFTKKDLKDNHIIELRNGKRLTVFETNIDLYSNNLIRPKINELSIMKVYEFDKLIWERKEEEILDEKEKEYLSMVLKPFMKDIDYICKCDESSSTKFIEVTFNDGDCMCFPNLKNNSMYKGMEDRKRYTLEELGLK